VAKLGAWNLESRRDFVPKTELALEELREPCCRGEAKACSLPSPQKDLTRPVAAMVTASRAGLGEGGSRAARSPRRLRRYSKRVQTDRIGQDARVPRRVLRAFPIQKSKITKTTEGL